MLSMAAATCTDLWMFLIITFNTIYLFALTQNKHKLNKKVHLFLQLHIHSKVVLPKRFF